MTLCLLPRWDIISQRVELPNIKPQFLWCTWPNRSQQCKASSRVLLAIASIQEINIMVNLITGFHPSQSIRNLFQNREGTELTRLVLSTPTFPSLPCPWTNFAGLHWQQYLWELGHSYFVYAHTLHRRASRYGSSDGFSFHFPDHPTSLSSSLVDVSTSIVNRAAPSVLDMVLPISSTRTVVLSCLCWSLYDLTYKNSSVTCNEQYNPTAVLFITCLQLMKLELIAANELFFWKGDKNVSFKIKGTNTTDIYLYIRPDYRPDFHYFPFLVFIFSRKIITEITAQHF